MRNIETDELADVDYPSHPEIPMSNSQYHFNYIILLADNLQMIFEDQADRVAVLGDIQWYPVEKRNDLTTAPDVMVCFGVPQDRGRNRTSYTQHREGGIGPSVVFEIDSESNTSYEVEDKRLWYETYGVQEYYWVFSETPEVRVFVREEDQLVEQTGISEWTSSLLGIRFDWSGTELQIFNPDGSLMRPTRQYAAIQRQRAELAEARANQEAQRAEQQSQRAEQEAQARQTAEQRAEHLAALLRQLGVDPDKLPPT